VREALQASQKKKTNRHDSTLQGQTQGIHKLPGKKPKKTSLCSHEKWHPPKERLLRRQIWHLKLFLPTEI